MVKICECCGHPVPEYDALSGMTRGQQAIFEAVEKAGTAGIRRTALMNAIYSHDPNGGPEYMGVLNVQRAKMKPVLEKHGLKIVTVNSGGTRWRLEKL